MTNATKMIIKALETNEGSFIDMHTGNAELRSIGYLVLEAEHKTMEYVCPIFENTFCLNPVVLKDGVLKLSTMSVGGNLTLKSMYGVDTDMVESEIARYNEIHKDGNVNCATLQKITSYELYTK